MNIPSYPFRLWSMRMISWSAPRQWVQDVQSCQRCSLDHRRNECHCFHHLLNIAGWGFVCHLCRWWLCNRSKLAEVVLSRPRHTLLCFLCIDNVLHLGFWFFWVWDHIHFLGDVECNIGRLPVQLVSHTWDILHIDTGVRRQVFHVVTCLHLGHFLMVSHTVRMLMALRIRWCA